MDNKLIGKYLQQKRKDQNMTQADLAKKLNVTYQAVSRWETGDSIPDIQTLSSLADLYKVSIDEILQRDYQQVNNETNEEDMLPVFVLVISFIHIVGYAIFYGFDYFNLSIIGVVIYIILAAAGLFIQHLGIFVKSNRTKKDILLYLACFVPLLITLLLII